MIAAIEANDIKPVVDKKVFTLPEVKDAYNYMVPYPIYPLFPFPYSLYVNSGSENMWEK